MVTLLRMGHLSSASKSSINFWRHFFCIVVRFELIFASVWREIWFCAKIWKFLNKSLGGFNLCKFWAVVLEFRASISRSIILWRKSNPIPLYWIRSRSVDGTRIFGISIFFVKFNEQSIWRYRVWICHENAPTLYNVSYYIWQKLIKLFKVY